MMTRRIFGLSALSAMALAGCGRRYKRLRYRLTVEVDTPAGMRSGSSVQEFVHGGEIRWLPGGDGFETRILGEAVAVDLPGAQTLFMLLPQSDRLLEIMLRDGLIAPPIDTSQLRNRQNTGWPKNRPGYIEALNKKRASIRLTKDRKAAFEDIAVGNRPILVRFRDLDDPRSVALVDPANLAASFGAGIALSSIVMQVTNEAVTSGIERRLRWLVHHKGSLYYDGQLHPEAPEKDITKTWFVQGNPL